MLFQSILAPAAQAVILTAWDFSRKNSVKTPCGGTSEQQQQGA